MMLDFNLDDMSPKELRALRKKVEKALEHSKSRKLREAREAVDALAKEHGFTLADLSGVKKPSKKHEVKYRHPDNEDLTWSGLGRRPLWLKNEIDAGTDIESFAVNK